MILHPKFIHIKVCNFYCLVITEYSFNSEGETLQVYTVLCGHVGSDCIGSVQINDFHWRNLSAHFLRIVPKE